VHEAQIQSFDTLRACPSRLEGGDERQFFESVRGT
jgi:hypothetical protein